MGVATARKATANQLLNHILLTFVASRNKHHHNRPSMWRQRCCFVDSRMVSSSDALLTLKNHHGMNCAVGEEQKGHGEALSSHNPRPLRQCWKAVG
jgi:hypothetical protein